MSQNLNDKKIYADIYDIFEQEFIAISQYVAIIEENNIAASNKIHELHLRVCAEIENILKIVIQRDFVHEKPVKGKPDFAHYLKIANKQFSLNKKYIRFLGYLYSSEFLICPFEEVKNSSVPKWWTAYNKLKHDKIANYIACNLECLINSLGGMYILVNYLIHHQKDNPRIHGSWRVPNEMRTPQHGLIRSKFFSVLILFGSFSKIEPLDQTTLNIRQELSENEYNKYEYFLKNSINYATPESQYKNENCVVFTYFDFEPISRGVNELFDATRIISYIKTPLWKFVD